MASLLSPAQIAQIKAALHDVTDTFCVTPVLYLKATDSLDRFNEDRKDMEPVEFNLLALVEYEINKTEDFIIQTKDGALVTAQVKLTFNTEDLETARLITANYPNMQKEKDYFVVHNKRHRVVHVSMDGPIDDKAVLVIVFGELQANKS